MLDRPPGAVLDASAPERATDGTDVVQVGGGRPRSGVALASLLDALRRDLAYGAYHPRERLVEADLVVRYSTTRAAVRDALIQLASEGLVERVANRGARVRGMTIAEAIEIAEVRRELESLCAARAAERGTPAERLRLQSMARALRLAADSNQVSEYLSINADFHQAIYAMASHDTAQRILDHFQHRPIDRFLPEPFRGQPPTASVDEHEWIATAIAAGDSAEAARAMRDHMGNLVRTLERHLGDR